MATTQQKLLIGSVRHSYIVSNNSGALSFHRVWLTDQCSIKSSAGKIDFSGDGTKITKYYGYQLEGNLKASADDAALDAILYNTPQVAPVGGDDFAYRYIKGGQGELQPNNVEVRISLDAYDGDTDAAVVVRYRILRCQFAPDTPPDFKSEAMAGRDLQFMAYLAATDIAGNALTGMPSTGAFMVKDIITNSANFDPDSELIF